MLTANDFKWEDFFWEAKIELAAWKGFQNRGGAYGSVDSDSASDGTVTVCFAPEGRDDAPLNNDELALIDWAVTHAESIQQAALAGLFKQYESIRQKYLDWLDEPDEMPIVAKVEEFKGLIGLHSVNVHQVSKDGMPYIGLEFGCNWDGEHGLGILMHGTRVVEIGGADTAILLWIAKRDMKDQSP